MYYDPEEEWVDQDILAAHAQKTSDSPQLTWLKNPDGTWKKVPTNQTKSDQETREPVASSVKKEPDKKDSDRRADYLSKYKVKPRTDKATTVPLRPQTTCPLPVPPPLPTLPPFQPPPAFPPPRGQDTDIWQCKMCKIKVQSEALFQMHLTTTHFREKIIRRIKPPFKCLMCGYSPPSLLKDSEKVEDLLMHYGTTERISVKFYEDACRELVEDESSVDKEIQQNSVECKICNLSLVGERTLLKHFTLRHFPKVLCDDLPKKIPFRCPFIDCHQTRQNLHSLMLHYGVDHNVSMELYHKHPKVLASKGHSTNLQSSSKVELPAAPRLAKLQAVVTPYHPESDEKMNQFRVPSPSQDLLREHSSSYVHGRKSWGNESHLRRLEELEERIRTMENVHRDKLKEKQAEFERWLAGKETRIEEEKTRRQELEETLSTKDKKLNDLKTELEIIHENLSRTEEDLNSKNRLVTQLQAFRDESEKELQEKENERINSYEELYIKEKELESLQEKFTELKGELEITKVRAGEEGDKAAAVQKDLETVCQEKESLEKELNKSKSEIAKKTRELDKKVEEIKRYASESPTRIKMKITKEKGSLRSSKIQVSPEMEALIKERDSLNEVLLKVQKSAESSITELQEQNKALKESKVEKQRVKDLEKEKKDLLKRIKVLESTMSNWETRQFTNVKLISGLEKERDGLQLQLKELKDGNLSHEDQLYWKDVAIKNAEKEVKTLKSAQEANKEENENLQRNLTEAQKICEDLKKEVAELQSKEAETTSKETVEEMEKSLSNKDNEIKHLKISLAQKTKDYSRVNTTAVCQKAELERLMRENERFESDYSQVITQLETLKNIRKDLESKLAVQKAEICELKNQLASSPERLRHATTTIDQSRRLIQRRKDSMMSQVLSEMNSVIKIREKGASPEKAFTSTIIKEEPEDFELYTEENVIDHTCSYTESEDTYSDYPVASDSSILVNFPEPNVDMSNIKSEPEVEDAPLLSCKPTEHLTDLDSVEDPSAKSASGSRKRKQNATTKNSKRNKPGVEDVTALYDDDEDHVLCGICHSWDPPEEDGETPTTKWVGCDCDRWFHKQCTGMKRISTKFSCRSVKMECLIVSITSDKIADDEEVLV